MWSLSSFTRNIVFGSASTISPSISIFSSFGIGGMLAAKLPGDRRELLGIGRFGEPRQLQRIVRVPGNHVHVEVEDRLPRCPADVVQHVESGRRKCLLHAPGDSAD